MEICQRMDESIFPWLLWPISQTIFACLVDREKSEKNKRKKLLNMGFLITIIRLSLWVTISDIMAEQVRENIGLLTESLLSESLDVNGSSLALFSDSPFTDNSINLDDSVFDDKGSNRDLERLNYAVIDQTDLGLKSIITNLPDSDKSSFRLQFLSNPLNSTLHSAKKLILDQGETGQIEKFSL